jgi:hypothetical protein
MSGEFLRKDEYYEREENINRGLYRIYKNFYNKLLLKMEEEANLP